jgi:hypothetical protein
MDSADGQELAAEIASAARRFDGQHELYLAKIRRATSRLTSSEVANDDLRGALLVVEDHARIDLDVPITSGRRAGGLAKWCIKRLIRWYLWYVGDQVTLLGHALVRLGSGVIEHTERLEEATGTLAAEVASLTARVDELEQGPHRT